MFVFGKVLVRVRNDEATAFTGIGPVGLRRRFRWSDVKEISLEEWGEEQRTAGASDQVAGGKALHIGWVMKKERQLFLLGALRQMRGR